MYTHAAYIGATEEQLRIAEFSKNVLLEKGASFGGGLTGPVFRVTPTHHAQGESPFVVVSCCVRRRFPTLNIRLSPRMRVHKWSTSLLRCVSQSEKDTLLHRTIERLFSIRDLAPRHASVAFPLPPTPCVRVIVHSDRS